MSIVKISQIAERIGTVLPCISGTIVSVFPSKSGKSQHGNWKLQNIQIEDETGKCQVTLSGIEQDLNESHKGKNIEFESVGTKFGLKGVTAEEKEWMDKAGNLKKMLGVKVTKTAKIKLEGAGMVQEDAPDDIPMEFNGEPKHMTAAQARTDKAIANSFPSSPPKSPEQRIAQFVKLYDMCLKQAHDITEQTDLSLDCQKDIATTFFIQSVREGLADKMEVEVEDPF